MEMSYCSLLQLQKNSLFFDYDLLLEKSPACDPSSDPGYVSAGGSSLSPTSSVDSFCFSPVSLQALGKEQDALNCFLFSSTLEPQPSQQSDTVLSSRPSSSATVPMKKSRSKYPSKKRQTASEREKLRMRDLTKALHHLRTYLPPSMAPAGQLTKIETLRLAIQYISYLSEELGLRREVLEQRRSSDFVEQAQTLSQFLDQPTAMNTEQLSSLHHSYQDLSAGYFTSEESWNHHEQSKALAFTGQ